MLVRRFFLIFALAIALFGLLPNAARASQTQSAAKATPDTLSDTLNFLVKPTSSVDELLKIVHFDNYNYNAVERYPLIGKRPNMTTLTGVLYRSASVKSFPEMEAAMAKRHLRPAVADELIAYLSARPDVINEKLIIALGEFWNGPDGHKTSPCIFRSSGQLILGTVWVDIAPEPNHWYLGIMP